MASELLFTSAVQGLKSGSQGYCTVQCTQTMPGPLAERLEALSAYRPIYPSQSEQAKLNPVNVAYWRIRAVGKTFPVLSRIADYGLDYSQRTNKLAHHLVIEPSEMSVAGPAAIAAAGSAFVTQWNQKVESIQQPRRLPVAASSMGVCRHWQTVMGDAGWAGVVAEEIIKDQKQPIFLIFEPGQEVLPLIVEVQSLLPAALRWKSTFSTYLTYLPPEAECQIRCLLKGSKEAHESLRHVNSLRIDLTQPKSAPSGPLAEAARTGVMPVQLKKPEAATAFDYEIDEEPPALPSHRGVAAEPLQLQVDESGRRPGPRGRRKQYSAAPVLPQKRGMGLYIAGGISVLVLSLVGGVVAMQFMKPGKEKPKAAVENVVQVETPVISQPEASVAVVSEPVASAPSANMVEVQTPILEPMPSVVEDSRPNAFSSSDPIPHGEMASNIIGEDKSNPKEGQTKNAQNDDAELIILYSKEMWRQETQILNFDTLPEMSNAKLVNVIFPKSNWADANPANPLFVLFKENSIKTVARGVNNESTLFLTEWKGAKLFFTTKREGSDRLIPAVLMQSVVVLMNENERYYLSVLPAAEYKVSGAIQATKALDDCKDPALLTSMSQAKFHNSWRYLKDSIESESLRLSLSKAELELELEPVANDNCLEFKAKTAGFVQKKFNADLTNHKVRDSAGAIDPKQNGDLFQARTINDPRWSVCVYPTSAEINFDKKFFDEIRLELGRINDELRKPLYNSPILMSQNEELNKRLRDLDAARNEFLTAMNENKMALEKILEETVTIKGTITYSVLDENNPIKVDFIRFKEPQK